MKQQQGFTLVELIIVIVLFSLLIGYTTLNLLSVDRQSLLTAAVSVLNSDLRQQQMKAMTGSTGGRQTHDSYGIYFSANSYTLFHGSTYNANDTSNYSVNISSPLQFTTTNFSIIFNSVSGEITTPATITLKNTSSNATETLQINSLGVVTQAN